MICVLDLTDQERCRVTIDNIPNSRFTFPMSLSWETADQYDNVRLALDFQAERKLRFRLDRTYADSDAFQIVIDFWFRLAFSDIPDSSSLTEFIIIYPSRVHWQTFLHFIKKIEENFPQASIVLMSEFAAAMMALILARSEKNTGNQSVIREIAILFFRHDTCLADITFKRDSNKMVSIHVNNVMHLPIAFGQLHAITSEIQMFFKAQSGRHVSVPPTLYSFCEKNVVYNRMKLLKTAEAFKSLSMPDPLFPNSYANSLILQRKSSKSVAAHLPEKDLCIKISACPPIFLTSREKRFAHCWKRRVHFRQPDPGYEIPYDIAYALHGSPDLDAAVIESGLLSPQCLGNNTIITSKITTENAFDISIETGKNGEILSLSTSLFPQASIMQHKPFFQEVP